MEPRQSSPHTGHHEVWLLLPWYVNGTLEGRELDLVQQHLQVCITCRKELAIQHRLAEAVRSSSAITLSPQAAFSRLREHIAGEAQPSKNKRRQHHHPLGWLRVSLPRLAAMAFLALVMLGLLILIRPSFMSVLELPKYHTLAEAESLAAAGPHDLRVIFARTTDQKQIQQVLLAVRGEALDGPSAIGVYTVRIASDGGSRSEMLAALEYLRHQPSVLFAEPVLAIPKAMPDADRDP